MERADRLRQAFNYIKSIGLAHSQKDVATAMGATPPNVSSALKGDEKVLTDKFLIRFNSAYNNLFVEGWLLTGEGEMLKVQSNARMAGEIYTVGEKDDGVLMVDYIPATATASFIENLGDASSTDFDKYPLVPFGNESSDAKLLRIFEVDGDSMYPTIPSGALILVKEIPEKSWHYAEGVVVAVYDTFVVVKRIVKNDLLLNNILVLGSDNKDYGQISVPQCDLRALYKAKRIISSAIR